MSKLYDMDSLSRLPAPADQMGLERAHISQRVSPGTAQKIDPEIRSPRISVDVLGKATLRIIQGATPVDDSCIWNQKIAHSPGNDGQSAVLERPPGPQVVIPIDLLDPFTLGFDPVTEPGKMRYWRIS